MTRAFVSYCHADEQYRAELEKHLSLLRRQGLIDIGSDHRIPQGRDRGAHQRWTWRGRSDHPPGQLRLHELGILLWRRDAACNGASSSGISDRCSDNRTPLRLDIIVARWPQGAPKRWQAGNQMANPWRCVRRCCPVASQAARWADRGHDATCFQLSCTAVIWSGSYCRSAAPPLRRAVLAKGVPRYWPRQLSHGGLRLYCRLFWEFAGRVSAAQPGYEGRFRRTSETGFTGTIYRDGKRVAGCYIRITHTYGSRGQIGYSGNDNPQDNSFNEILSVEIDPLAENPSLLRSIKILLFQLRSDESLIFPKRKSAGLEIVDEILIDRQESDLIEVRVWPDFSGNIQPGSLCSEVPPVFRLPEAPCYAAASLVRWATSQSCMNWVGDMKPSDEWRRLRL